MKNFDNFKYNKSAIPQDAAEKEEFFKQLEKEFFEEVKNSEKSKKYLDKFYSSGGEFFPKDYARKKAELIKLYEYYQRNYYQNEENELGFQKRAEKAIDAILHKKLFNLQLQWRAGKIELPGVDVCYDFEYHGRFIRSCPFIPPVTPNEIQLMKDFLQKIDDPQDFEESVFFDLQDYNYIMAIDAYGDRGNMPEWYTYYDIVMGTSILLTLPDIKGKEEEYYRTIAREHAEKKASTSNIPPRQFDNRPMISSYGSDIVNFAREIETDPYILELFKYYEFEVKDKDEKPDYWELNKAFDVLSSADRPIYFDPMKKWDEAIFLAVFKYENIRTVEALDFAYEEYLMYMNLGFSVEETTSKYDDKEFYNQLRTMYFDSVQKGKNIEDEIRGANK